MENPELIEHDQKDSNPNPAIKWGWLRAFLQFIVWVVIVVVIQGMVAVAVISIKGQDPASLTTENTGLFQVIGVTGMTVIYMSGLVCTLLAVGIFRKFIDKKSMLSLGFKFKEYRNDLFAGMGWGFVLILIVFLVLWLSGIVNVTGIRFNPLSVFIYFILFIIVALNEEILMRGYILSNLMDSMNKYVALFFTSILFSVMHLINANASIFSTCNLFLAGILLGVYFIHKGNLWFPIGMHLTWNFFQGPVFGFRVSGYVTDSIITQDITGSELITGGEFGMESSIITTITMIILITLIHYKYRKA